MTRLTPEFDQRIAEWLEDDPGQAPSQVAVSWRGARFGSSSSQSAMR